MSGSNGAGRPSNMSGKQPGYDNVIAQLKRRQSRDDELAAQQPEALEPSSSNASSEGPVRRAQNPESAGRAQRLQNVRAELARVQEELDDTVSLRQEAEEMDEPELLEECLAIEKRLQGLVADLTAEIGRLQKPAGSEALRERLRRIKEGEARARSLLGHEASPGLKESNLSDSRTAATPEFGSRKEPQLKETETASTLLGGFSRGTQSSDTNEALGNTSVPSDDVPEDDARVEAHHVKDAAPLEAPGPASQAGPGLAGPVPAAEAEDAEGAASTDKGVHDSSKGATGLVASAVSRITASIGNAAASVLPASVVGGATDDKEAAGDAGIADEPASKDSGTLGVDAAEEAEANGSELQEPGQALPRAADVGETVSSKPVEDEIVPLEIRDQATGAGLEPAEPAADTGVETLAVKTFEDVEHVPETESVAATIGSDEDLGEGASFTESAFAGSDVTSLVAGSEAGSQSGVLASLPTKPAARPSSVSSQSSKVGSDAPSQNASGSAGEPAKGTVSGGVTALEQLGASKSGEGSAVRKTPAELKTPEGEQRRSPVTSAQDSGADKGLSLEEGDWGRSISLKDAFLAKQEHPQQPQPGQGHQRRSSDGGMERRPSVSWEAFDSSPQALKQDLHVSELIAKQAPSSIWQPPTFAPPKKADVLSGSALPAGNTSQPVPSFEEASFPSQTASADHSAAQSPTARSVGQSGNPFQARNHDFYAAGGVVPVEHDRSATASPSLSNPYSDVPQFGNVAWPPQGGPSSRAAPDPFDALSVAQPAPSVGAKQSSAVSSRPATSGAGLDVADSRSGAGPQPAMFQPDFPPAQPVQPAFAPKLPVPEPSLPAPSQPSKGPSVAGRGFDGVAFPDDFASEPAFLPPGRQPAASGAPALSLREPPGGLPPTFDEFGDLAFPSSAAPAQSGPGTQPGKMPLFKAEASQVQPQPSSDPAAARQAPSNAPANEISDPFRARADGLPAFAPEKAGGSHGHSTHGQPNHARDPLNLSAGFHVTHSMVIPEADWEAAFAPAKQKAQAPVPSLPPLSKQPSIPSRQPPPPPTAARSAASAVPANGAPSPATSKPAAAAPTTGAKLDNLAFPQVFAPGSANSVQKLSEVFKAEWPGGAKPAQPPVEEEVLDPAVWVPMSEHDRGRCEQAFTTKFHGSQDGVGLGEARELYTRAELKTPFADIFRLSDMDSDGRLKFPEFLLFMYLLKALRRGVVLPKRLSPAQVSHLLGKDLAALSGPAANNVTPQAPTGQPVGQAGQPVGQVGQPGGQAGSPAKPGVSRELAMLLEQGYSEEQSKRALFLHSNDLELASNWLAERPLEGGQPTGPSLRASTAVESPTSSGPPSPTPVPPASSVPAAARGSPGVTGERLAVRVEKAALSYKKAVDRPLFTLTLRDAWGNPLEPLHDTPPCQFDRASGTVLAEHTVKMETPVSNIPEGSVLYVELKHWKAGEKKWSTLGWTFAPAEAFLDASHVRAGPLHLHMYHKPIDTRAHFRAQSQRKLKALSSSHDLHLRISPAT